MKILFIACYSPLINNSASIETLQYLNNLAKIDGNEIHLLTVNFPKNSIYYDEYIFKMLDKRVKTHIISGGFIFEKIMPKRNNSKINKNKIKRFSIKSLLKRAKRIIAIPDMYYNWAIRASKYGIKLMEKESFDVMFSMHEPPSSHICAYRIKMVNKKLRWITYWSDPWLKDSTREGSSLIRRKLEGKYEKKIVENSNEFIFVTKENRDDYIKTYNISKDKTKIITRGYDEDMYKKISLLDKPYLIKPDKINIVYAGEIFSKLRDVTPYVKTLEKIRAENKVLYSKLNILFFGNIDDPLMKNSLKDIDVVKVENRIPYNEALRYMINSDILLLFGNKNSKQIPAKIYDYFGCKGYILVILGDEKDPIIELTKDLEKCLVVKNNIEDIEKGIEELSKKTLNGILSNEIKEYEWKNISKKLNQFLRGE
ncbi:glycosyltransferase [Clostridium sp.]|uniref:glycosyltransferase n=1 Tax=Clostridium sp. TaxID=1506 RepID=UPI002605118D|nr:glycosyltransferase [Clostridium sp.]